MGKGGVGDNLQLKTSSVRQICSCLGNRHDEVTNCTHCGYIICAFEFSPENRELDLECHCPICGTICTLVAMISSPCDERTLTAYRQKEILLQYDQEHAKRTIVHDAQADYYISSAWLTDEERKLGELKERKRLESKNLSLRNKRVNIRFDIAGRKVVEAELDDHSDVESNMDGQSDVVNADINSDVDKTDAFSSNLGNIDLILRSSKAAEVYRYIRKRYGVF